MAVHHLSLEKLARFRASRPHAQNRRPATSGTGVEETDEEAPPTRMKSQTPPATGNAESPSSVAEILSRSGPELDEFLAERGQPVGTVLIALIYRLGAIETQLARLCASRSAPSTKVAHSGRSGNLRPDADGTGKNALLDQVFRNNMALRDVG